MWVLASVGGALANKSQSEGSILTSRDLMLVLGFSSTMAWNAISGTPTVFNGAEDLTTTVDSYDTLENLTHLVLLLALGITALFGRVNRKVMFIGVAGCLFVGTVLYHLCLYGVVTGTPFEITSVLLTSSSAILGVLWGEAAFHRGIPGLFCRVSMVYVLQYGFVFILAYLPCQLTVTARCVLPLASMAFYLSLHKTRDEGTIGESHDGSAGRSLPWGMLAGVGVLGAIVLLSNGFSESKSAQPDEFLSLVSGLVTSLILLGLSFALRDKVPFAQVFRLVLPAVVTCSFVVLLAQEGQQPYEVSFVGGCWTYYIVSTWALWGTASQKSSASPLATYSFGLAFLAVFSAIASIINPSELLATTDRLLVAGALCLAAVLVSVILLDPSAVADDMTMPTQPVSLDLNDSLACKERVRQVARNAHLTDREADVALLMLLGNESGQIAQTLCISQATLRTHQRNLYKKLGVHSHNELIDFIIVG